MRFINLRDFWKSDSGHFCKHMSVVTESLGHTVCSTQLENHLMVKTIIIYNSSFGCDFYEECCGEGCTYGEIGQEECFWFQFIFCLNYLASGSVKCTIKLASSLILKLSWWNKKCKIFSHFLVRSFFWCLCSYNMARLSVNCNGLSFLRELFGAVRDRPTLAF